MSERVRTIAHNAAINPEKLQRALASEAPHIEVDLTIVDGKLVAAHSPDDYRKLPNNLKFLQKPSYVFRKIAEHGKEPFLDLKDEIVNVDQIREIVKPMFGNKNAMPLQITMGYFYNYGLLDLWEKFCSLLTPMRFCIIF